jgi:hypothetical protein
MLPDKSRDAMRTASMVPLVNDRLHILDVRVPRELRAFTGSVFVWMNRCGDSAGSQVNAEVFPAANLDSDDLRLPNGFHSR